MAWTMEMVLFVITILSFIGGICVSIIKTSIAIAKIVHMLDLLDKGQKALGEEVKGFKAVNDTLTKHHYRIKATEDYIENDKKVRNKIFDKIEERG